MSIIKKCMKEFFTSVRFKLIVFIMFFGIAFVMGAYARPAVDEVFAYFAPEPTVAYVAEPVKSDFEKAVIAYETTTSHVDRCHEIAKAQVSLEWAGLYMNITEKAQKRVSELEMRALNGITDTTATATVALEVAQGRR